MSELDRAVAELLGWKEKRTPADIPRWRKGESLRMWEPAPYSTDANQALAAVREWCGEDRKRQDLFVEHLVAITSLSGDGLLTEFYSAITATPEELSCALLAAAKEPQ